MADTNSPFRLPADPTRPLILVGAGTGIAPLRGFLAERAHQRREGAEIGPIWLFFGCRSEAEHLYRAELEAHAREGVLTHLHPAYSRASQGRAYVQDLIRAQAQEIWRAIEGGGHILVCGDSKRMAPDVAQAFAEAFAEAGGIPLEAALSLRDQLIADGRYAQDVWAS